VKQTGIDRMPFISLDRTRSTGPAGSRSFGNDRGGLHPGEVRKSFPTR
jgi:hypothetical protein